jgi:hypothetical protein
MPTRPMLCPHCHSPIDPAELETAVSPVGVWQVCPACDEPVLFQPHAGPPAEHPKPDLISPVLAEF